MLQQQSSASSKIKFKLSLTLLVIMAALLAIAYYNAKPKSAAAVETATATVFTPPRSVQAFHLGRPSFSQENLAQHWTFLFFGYTHCNDVCPTTLTELKEAYPRLQALQPEVQVVFVSIDPSHDQAATLQKYLANFSAHFIGVSGRQHEVLSLQQQFGVAVTHDPESTSLGHTASLFLINPQGQWIAVFPYGLRAPELVTQFKTIVDQTTHA